MRAIDFSSWMGKVNTSLRKSSAVLNVNDIFVKISILTVFKSFPC